MKRKRPTKKSGKLKELNDVCKARPSEIKQSIGAGCSASATRSNHFSSSYSSSSSASASSRSSAQATMNAINSFASNL